MYQARLSKEKNERVLCGYPTCGGWIAHLFTDPWLVVFRPGYVQGDDGIWQVSASAEKRMKYLDDKAERLGKRRSSPASPKYHRAAMHWSPSYTVLDPLASEVNDWDGIWFGYSDQRGGISKDDETLARCPRCSHVNAIDIERLGRERLCHAGEIPTTDAYPLATLTVVRDGEWAAWWNDTKVVLTPANDPHAPDPLPPRRP